MHDSLKLVLSCLITNTDIFGYNATGYSDTPLTATVWVIPMQPKSVTVSKYLLLVTLFSYPEGVTLTEDVCMVKTKVKQTQHKPGFGAYFYPGDCTSIVAAEGSRRVNATWREKFALLSGWRDACFFFAAAVISLFVRLFHPLSGATCF